MSFPRPSCALKLLPILVLGLFLAAPVRAFETAGLTAPDPGPGDTDPTLYEPVLAADQEDIYAETAGRLTRYRIEATLAPAGDQPATITGTLDLSYYNNTGEPQDSLYFRLYPNDEEYAEGEMELGDVEVNGTSITPELSVDDTVAEVRLPEAVEPEATVDLQTTFTTTIPSDPGQSYGMFGLDSDTGTYALAHWEPLLAGYDPSEGWNLDPPSNFGDPVFTDAALYEVTLTLPDDLAVVATGSETGSEAAEDGQTRHSLVSGPVRDFVMVIDDDLEAISEDVGGTTVRSWFKPGHAERAADVLRYGAQSLAVYSRLFGAYPYEEMDIVEIDLRAAAGVEFPQITFIEQGYYEPNSSSLRRDPNSLEFTVAHEIAHQWWYGMVGNDQYDHAFIDEGLTNFVTTIYFREMYGEEMAAEQTERNLELWYLAMLYAGGGDQIVDQPTDGFPTQNDYGAAIYGKSALGFAAVHAAIGDDAFFDALTAYVQNLRFKVATPNDLRAAFEQSSGEDLDELWNHWFKENHGEDDYSPAEFTRLRRLYLQ